MLNNKEKASFDIFKSFLNKNVNSFILLVFVLIIFLGAVLFIYPLYKDLEQKKTTNEEILIKNQKTKKQIDETEKLIASYNNIDPQKIEKINSILPKKEVKEELYSFFYYLISRNGLVLTNISLKEEGASVKKTKDKEEPDQLKDFEIVKASLSVLGVNYLGLKNLLREIENSLLILDVQSLNFNPLGNSLNMEININYLK